MGKQARGRQVSRRRRKGGREEGREEVGTDRSVVCVVVYLCMSPNLCVTYTDAAEHRDA